MTHIKNLFIMQMHATRRQAHSPTIPKPTISSAPRGGHDKRLRAPWLVLCVAAVALTLSAPAAAQFAVVADSRPAALQLSEGEDAGIVRAAHSLAADIEAVCGQRAAVTEADSPEPGRICIGAASSALIGNLARQGRIDLGLLSGCREKYLIVSTDTGLIVAGSDKRGTIYGIYELSRRLGVTAWTWWADAPVARRRQAVIPAGVFTDGEPAVEYRGIFLNDEWPSLGSWAVEKFGGFNHRFYAKVFELVLRLRGNFMWPAMWGSAFYDDDPLNGPLAHEMGIVMGTSHHEPMAMAQQDWKRRGQGAWDYRTNRAALDAFWQQGIERCRDWETMITVGMRGDGDEPMSDEANISLLTSIVGNQRRIISKVTGRKAAEVPQVWALYKEVQDYYDRGMRVPDDVTLLLCDDNWGNIRRLPAMDAKERRGGYGMYYHFDYVGGPRNYKWLNVTQVQRIWEQMSLCYRHGVSKLWIVNVGDLKPMEYPIQFFMDMAWAPERITADSIAEHTRRFCASIFGGDHAERIAELIGTYSKYNARRTPEMLDASTFSLTAYDEWQRVLDDYRSLELRAQRLALVLPDECRDAYDQLVLYPISACANLYEMYHAAAMNRSLAARHDPEANRWAQTVAECYERDSLLTLFYHRIAGGKWNHMMDQIHIGYTYWQQPDRQTMPQVEGVREPRIAPPPPVFAEADGYVSVEAEHTARRSGSWTLIPDMGRTLSALTATDVTPDTWLEYDMELTTVGPATIEVCLSPTLDYEGRGLRYAVSVDGGAETTVDIHGRYDIVTLERWQADHANISRTTHLFDRPGRHTVRIRPLDNALVFQKLTVDMGGLMPSYLGAPESRIITDTNTNTETK